MSCVRSGVALAAIGFGLASPAMGALVEYSFNDTSDSTKKTGATAKDPNLNASTVSAAGGGDISATTDMAFFRSDATGGTTLATAITAGDYFQFTLTPNANTALNFSSFTFDYGGTTNAGGSLNANFALLSSLKPYASANAIATFNNVVPVNQNTFASTDAQGTALLNAPEFRGVTTAITFRIYVWDTQNSNDLINRFDNVVVDGVAIVPEPSAAATLLLAPLAFALRRRSGRWAR